MTIEPRAFRFTNYTLAVSTYDEVDVENVAFSRKDEASLELKPELLGPLAAVTASLRRENSTTRSYVNREQTAVLTIGFRPDRLDVVQTGRAGEDLSGQLLVNAGVRPATLDGVEYEAVVTDMRLQDPAGAHLAAARASLTIVTDKLARASAVAVCAGAQYVERVAVGGREYVDEGRQAADERRRHILPATYELVPSEEVAPPLWGLADVNGPIATDTALGVRSISFESELDASRFARWMSVTGAAQAGAARMYSAVNGRYRRLLPARSRTMRVYSVRGAPPPFRNERCEFEGSPLNSTVADAPSPVAGTRRADERR